MKKKVLAVVLLAALVASILSGCSTTVKMQDGSDATASEEAARGTAEARAVKTRDAFLGWAPIIEGLEAGETVVISGVGKVMPGAKLAVVPPTPNEDIAPGSKPGEE